MKFRNTWILAGIAVAFGAYVYFGEYKKGAKEDEEKAANEKVLNVEPGKVSKIEIKNHNGDFVVSRSGDKSWNLESPLKDAADEPMISGILTALTGAKFDQAIEGEEAKSFGLENSATSIAVTLKEGGTKKVSVGNDAPVAGKVYLQRDEDKKILFADSVFKTQLDRSLRDFREKKIFRKNKDDVTSLIIKYVGKEKHGAVGLVKRGADWIMAEKGDKADQDTISTLLTNLDGLRATDFPSEKGDDPATLKKYGLDKPETDIRLEDKDQKPLAEILISPKKDNNIFIKVAGEPTVYQAFGGAGEQLLHNPEDFRDKKEPFDIKKEDIAEIQITVGGVETHLIKKTSNWELALPDSKKEVSQIQVVNFLDKIGNLRVSEFVPNEKPLGLNSPKGNLVLKDSKGQNLLVVTWGEATKSKRSYFTRTSKVPFVFGTDTTALNGLTGQPLVSAAAPSATPIVESGVVGSQRQQKLEGKAEVAPPKPEVIDVKQPGK